jgi:RimJ/RimL family protein N-acetyltransferase
MLARGTLRGVLRFPDPPLADDAITLRPKALADADALVAACQDPEIPRWTRVPRPYGRAHAIEWIEGSGETLAKGTSIDWLAVDAGDTVLASVGLMEIDSERGYGEIGYWVAREARGRGVATRAVRLVRDWAHRVLGLAMVEIMVHEENHPSRAVARSAGFEEIPGRRPSPRDGVPEGAYVVHVSRAPSSA